MRTVPHAQQPAPHAPVHVPTWAWSLVAVALLALYLLVQDNGAVLAQAGDLAHEVFHDARHSLGVPCH